MQQLQESVSTMQMTVEDCVAEFKRGCSDSTASYRHITKCIKEYKQNLKTMQELKKLIGDLKKEDTLKRKQLTEQRKQETQARIQQKKEAVQKRKQEREQKRKLSETVILRQMRPSSQPSIRQQHFATKCQMLKFKEFVPMIGFIRVRFNRKNSHFYEIQMVINTDTNQHVIFDNHTRLYVQPNGKRYHNLPANRIQLSFSFTLGLYNNYKLSGFSIQQFADNKNVKYSPFSTDYADMIELQQFLSDFKTQSPELATKMRESIHTVADTANNNSLNAVQYLLQQNLAKMPESLVREIFQSPTSTNHGYYGYYGNRA